MFYFFPIDARRFHEELKPALAASWHKHSFTYVRNLCREIGPATRTFLQTTGTGAAEPLVMQAAGNLPFRPEPWRLLVGEILLFSADNLPELEAPLSTYALLLGLQLAESRPDFSPIQQAILGTRDMQFGAAYYRPESAGFNDSDDVARLAVWLTQIDSSAWDADRLLGVPVQDRPDELAFAQEWFPPLASMYERAARLKQVIVCESI